MLPAFIRRVELQNYRSVARCGVDLGPLTVLVGKNGSGKSNFLDALRLVSDALSTSLEHALRDRGGVEEVRRRSAGHPTHFAIRLLLRLPAGGDAMYAFSVAAEKDKGFKVQQEQARIWPDALSRGQQPIFFERDANGMRTSLSAGSAPLGIVEHDRLHLPLMASLADFRPIYDGLSRMCFYQLQPAQIGGLQDPDQGEWLARDGSNLASVVRRLKRKHPDVLAHIEEHLGRVVSEVSRVDVQSLGPKEQITVSQEVDDRKPWNFPGSSLSDGTLRALGVLVAAFQAGREGTPAVYGIEEPEAAIHPGAVPFLSAALREASGRSQILLTTHSPDLLSEEEFPAEAIRVVAKQRGKTMIEPMDEASREIVRKKLYSPGELLRQNQLVVTPSANGGAALDLFRKTRPEGAETP